MLGRRDALPRWRTRTPYLLAAVLAAAATFGLKDTHAGVRDTALNLGTGGAYVAFGDPAKLDLSAFTVETWFKRTGTGTSNSTGTGGVPLLLPLLTHGAPEAENSNVDANWILGISTSGTGTTNVLAADFEEGATGASPGLNHPVYGTTVIANDVWHHAAATYDGNIGGGGTGTWKLYLDGNLETSLVVGRPPRSDSIQRVGLGAMVTSTGTPLGRFVGVLDEARVWDHARTGAEILAARDQELTSGTGLVARWGLNDGTGTAVTDSIATAANGTITGSGSGWVAGFVPPAGSGAPNAPSLNAPSDGATGIGTSPTLSIDVSDPDSDPLTVTFFGRPLASGNFVQIGQNTGVASGSTTTKSWPGLGAGQEFEWYATVSDGTHTTTGPTWTFHTADGADPVFVGVGDIAACTNTNDTDTAAIIQGIDGSVFTVGDNVYPSGTASDFTNCYAPSWGIPSIKSRTRPIPGNHDWGNTGTASDNLDGYFGYFGTAATDANGKSYYSYDIPASNWHIVNLDSECEDVPGGCTAGSPQELWLKADLAANSTKNVIALWHKPIFSSAGSHLTDLQPFVNDLYAAGADLVMDGHDHVYETISPLDASGTPDAAHGIRYITIGSGGDSHQGFGTPIAGSETREANTYGILKLTLHPSSYDWTFLPVAGSTFTDSGTQAVHDAPPGANNAPVATADSYTTALNTAKVVAAPGVLGNDTDADSDPLTAVLNTDVGHGTLSLAANGGFTYTPTSGYSGPDSFTYHAFDGTDGSNVVTVSLTVTAANSAPNAPTLNAPGNGATGIGTSPTLSVDVSDPNSDPLTVTFFGRPFASGNFVQIGQNTGVASGSTTTKSWAGLGTGQEFEWYATVGDGTATTTGPTWTFHTAAGADPVFVGVGDIASCAVTEDTATGNIIQGIEGNVFTVGDNVYDTGTSTEYGNCYATIPWGSPGVKSRTRPAPGNHDWGNTGTASDNLNGYFGYFGAAATDADGHSYYSYDIPSSNWHVVVLDSECEDVPGGCTAGSAQELWLKADLAANSSKNVIAIWHKPRYSSGATQYQAVQPLWDDLYAAGVDILLDGHDHVYERTAPEKSGATLSSPPVADPTYGIRQFTIGTGGEGHHGLVTPLPTSEIRNDQTFGIFKLTLHATSYDWVFLPIAGSTFTDSGTGTVHAAPSPAGQTILHPGDSLTSGQSITSPNGVYRLAMQSDGNLVAYDGASVVWASGTNPGGAVAVMQGDGNFVVYNASNVPLWASDTSGNPGAYFTVGNTGQLGVVSVGGSTTLWAPRQLSSDRRLRVGESVYSSGGRYRLTMQTDGNLVEYNQANFVVWASGTSVAGSTAVVQSDGNVVVYDGSHTALWASDTGGHPGASLRLRDTGQLRVESASGALLWAGPAELVPQRQLTLGQTLRSPSGAYRLTLQGDGNLVEYSAGNAVVWATGTSTGNRLIMQGDGNLVLYDNADSPLWASNTSGHPGASVTLLDGGQLVVADAAGAALWAGPGALLHDRTLAPGDSFGSPTGAYQLTMQAGGNLVLHQGATVAWSSGTSTAGSHAVLQGDGNLVVYSGSTPLWASNTAGQPGDYLVVGDDGTIALISTAGDTRWSAG